jgi:hypothetical protein
MKALRLTMGKEDRKPLNDLVKFFFPSLEVVIQNIQNNVYQGEHMIEISYNLAKIFYFANMVSYKYHFIML